ncbi:MAG: DUF4129 domain-containing protein [Pseudomonadota bacterium]
MQIESRTGLRSKGAIEIIEEAVQLIRLLPAAIFAYYYAGSLPFILGLIYFWADMSRSAPDDGYCAAGALGLSVLFIWMKCWQSVFASEVRGRLGGEPPPRWTAGRIGHLVSAQSAVQPFGLIALPVASFIVLPFGWVYAFFQSVTVLGCQESGSLRAMFQKARHESCAWPRENHFLLFYFSLFGIVVFLNIATIILCLPWLLKTLFGMETVFTRSFWGMLNTTFLVITAALTYLCMDPLIKTVYVLRSFYSDSIESGADLKAELNSFKFVRRLASGMLMFWLIAGGPFDPGNAAAETNMNAGPVSMADAGMPVSPEELDRSISEIISRREYSWRIPRKEPVPEERKGALYAFVAWLADITKTCLETVAGWLAALAKWLGEILDGLFPDRALNKSGTGRTGFLKGVIWALLAILLGLLAALFGSAWKKRLRRRTTQTSGIPSNSETADLSDDRLTADQKSLDAWLALSGELVQKGDFRPALRALYLASLVFLAEHSVITIARFKSNRDYKLELQRKSHARPELIKAFSLNIDLFDRSWYGNQTVTGEEIEEFRENQKRIAGCLAK